MTRFIDHCVLPVPDLAVARDRLTVLGFTVAPQGDHPFGTVNCCVYFQDDTFLEPLAIGDRTKVEEAIAQDNMFIALDAAYREEVAENGLSALVFKTDDARADHAAFEGEGISAGPMLDFSRPFIDATGAERKVSFRLAFAAQPSSRSAYFFTCQRIDAPASAKGALEMHANGVLGISGIEMFGDKEPASRFLSSLLGTGVALSGKGLLADLGNKAHIALHESEEPVRLSGIRFRVGGLHALGQFLTSHDIDFHHAGHEIRVGPALGQGVDFIFEEMP